MSKIFHNLTLLKKLDLKVALEIAILHGYKHISKYSVVRDLPLIILNFQKIHFRLMLLDYKWKLMINEFYLPQPCG